ncbi:S-adenosyl-L-methionine-dependent methyltransferase [Xylariomycetidae sp. FL2044]|nr:S-adenosyl-L-methionine-dependent methyltransferase [Xylariomycetidae sp. FL2044]
MSSRPEYVFTRDFLDNNRINLMHHFWTKVFGYLIHPKIPTERSDLRVADIGTGTGIWLLDVGEQVSKSARLDGLDVSFKAAPPPESLPSNVALRHWDVRDDVPEDLVNVFDIVHVRFFSLVIMNEEVPSVVDKLFKLLRPGGYLQWGEPDMESIRIDKSKPENKTDNLSKLMKTMAVQDPRFSPKWATKLPEIFAASGFVDVDKHICDAPPHLSFMLHECGLIMHELIARKTKNEEMARQLEHLLPQAVEETREGAYVSAVRWTVIGRKP